MKKLLGSLVLTGLTLFLNPAFASVDNMSVQALSHIPVCPPGAPDGVARCHAQVVTDQKGQPDVSTSPTGLTPAQLHSGYALPTTVGSKQIIAIVDAYDNPTVKADLDTFSTQFGIPTLPDCAGTVASSATACFAKVDQNGGNSYPSVDGGWALEISLDVQVAHSICQNCSILLVEANSSSFADLMTAVDQAGAQGARIISNSYGSSREFSGENTFDFHFQKPGYVFTFSSGDAGYGTSYPAASPYVTSVGGTSLFLNSDGSYNSESVWSGAGSGCSQLESKLSFQSDSGCAARTIADVSAVADPNTGMSVYDSTPYNGTVGWYKVGGTSLSAPLIASVYALAGGVASNVMGNTVPYASKVYGTNMHDVTSGSNGSCSRGRNKSSAYLCTGVSGYDGPSGLGTPNGLGAF
jgi:subtilase family serine protease